MSARTLTQRGPAIRMRTLSLAALGTAVVVTGVAVVPDLLTDDDALPTEVDGVPTSYRIVYRVEAGDAVTTEVLTVVRPFGSRLVVHEGDSQDGPVISERASDLGSLATRSRGAAWGRLVVPPALATADVRPDPVLVEAVAAGLLDDLGEAAVDGRACRRYETASSVAGGTLRRRHDGERAVVCIDAAGLVLDEQWEIDGEVVRHRRAVALDVDPDLDDRDVRVPHADEIEGSGELRAIGLVSTSPFAADPRLTTLPDGFEHQGRYAVVPPDLSATRQPELLPDTPDVATITDVWVRGADVMILDHGATTGADPFAASDVAEPVDLGLAGIDAAELVLDLRATELRIRLDDGGFIRLAGTLPPDELVELARGLTITKGDGDG